MFTVICPVEVSAKTDCHTVQNVLPTMCELDCHAFKHTFHCSHLSSMCCQGFLQLPHESILSQQRCLNVC